MTGSVSRALVTGGAGFIGSHIVDELLSRGIETVVVDNFSTGSLRNLGGHSNDPRLKVITGDISDIEVLMAKETPPDIVFHEAAIASVPKSVEDPLLVNTVNVDSSLKVMNYAVHARVKRLVFASSAAVYGSLAGRAASEDMLCRPASPYGSSKLAVETYLSSFMATYGLETVALRYFNVYGPRQGVNEYSGVITVFANNLLQGKTPTIFGDGKQTRDFVFVKDIVGANLLAMETQTGVGQSFNVASGRSITILELLQIMQEITGVKEEPRFMPPRAGDVRSGDASVSKTEQLLGYRAATTLKEGLTQFIDSTRAQTQASAVQLKSR
jgi:UDP-glucose 4-epimerase